MTTTLKEAERLYRLGFGILWIKPKSKAPVKSKWTTGPRDSWENLKKSYKPGYNLGVRLGTPSMIGEKYLAVIDIDVKSTEKRHQEEAEKAVRELFPQLPSGVVQVLSGRGNGSSHIYIVTKAPAQPSKRKVSIDKVKVLMPSAPINPAQREALSEEDLNEGWRMRAAWEVAVMGEGQQVVLPPSTHPDTNKEYAWKMQLRTATDLVEVEVGHKEKDLTRTTTEDWKPEEYDLISSSLPDDIVKIILDAEVEDRSAAVFKVVIAMIREGLTDRQIMTVLTDRTYALANAAFDHAKTDSRERAANWIFNYTIKKARKETDARFQFNEEVEAVPLDEKGVEAQRLEMITPPDWRNLIDKNGPRGENANKPKSTLKNIVLILTNEVSVDVFKRDSFAWRDFYAHSTPWGGVKDTLLGDPDALKIKYWLAQRHRFEPKKELVYEAMNFLAERNSFDPVKEYLEGLPEWDGVNRLDTWLAEHFEAEGDPDYLAQVFRKWLTAMVMRIYSPGSKFDWMPIFEGKQGIGKSSIGRLLVGEKYFVDWLPDLSNKDSALSLQGAWAVEFGELANLRKQDVEVAKAFISRTVDKVRPPYGRMQIESARRCVFFGTTNSETYLRDDSGNRRFKPVKVGQLDFDALARDKEQLFAEAVCIYKNEFETERTMEIEGTAKIYEAQIQADKMVEDDSDLMKEEILDFIEKPSEQSELAQIDFENFTIKSLFEGVGPLSKWKGETRDTMFAAKALKALGGRWNKKHGRRVWTLKIAKKLSGETSGRPLNGGIPVKNISEINH